MELSEHDLRRILNPEPLTPEQQCREEFIQRAIRDLGTLSLERLRSGIRVDLEAAGFPATDSAAR